MYIYRSCADMWWGSCPKLRGMRGSVIDRAYGVVNRAGGHLGCRTRDLQSWAGYLGRDAEVQWDWAGQGQFDIYFSVFFHCCCRSLISG